MSAVCLDVPLRTFLRFLGGITIRYLWTGTNTSQNLQLLDIYFQFLGESDEEAFFTSEISYQTLNPSWYFCDFQKRNIDSNLLKQKRFRFRVCRADPEQIQPNHPQPSESNILIETIIDTSELVLIDHELSELSELPTNSIFFHYQEKIFVPRFIFNKLDKHIQFVASQVDPSISLREHFGIDNSSEQTSEEQLEIEAACAKVAKDIANSIDNIKFEEQTIRNTNYLNKLLQELKMLENEDEQEEMLLAAEQDTIAEEIDKLKALTNEIEQLKQGIDVEYKLLEEEKNELSRANFLLESRQIKLLSELSVIYPIEKIEGEEYTIRHLELPRDFASREDEHVSSALGYVCHLTLMLSKYLQIPLRYQIQFSSSRSTISDYSFGSTNWYPLYKKGTEKDKFERGVRLLEKDIEQILNARGVRMEKDKSILHHLYQLFDHEIRPQIK